MAYLIFPDIEVSLVPMTLIIFVIFSFGHNLHIRLKLYKIGHCLTNLYAVSSLAVDAFSYFWKENLWKKIIQAELLFLLAFFFFFYDWTEYSILTYVLFQPTQFPLSLHSAFCSAV